MRSALTLLVFLACTSLQAQTKKIAFKSHSGNMNNFHTALENDLFDTDNSNFGQAPQRDVYTARLDSVIFVSDSLAILVTSEYCTRMDRFTDKAAGTERLWKAGRETARNHPLFSRKHSLDSIKKVIAENYSFRNPVNKVVFVGYDNKKPKEKKKKEKEKKKCEDQLIVSGKPEQPPYSPNGQLVFLLGTVMVVSIVAGKSAQRNS